MAVVRRVFVAATAGTALLEKNLASALGHNLEVAGSWMCGCSN